MAPVGALQVAAFYAFAPMQDLAGLRSELLAGTQTGQVFGTVLLAEEGVNGTVCGPETAVQALLALLRRRPGLEGLTAKLSWAPQQAFHRLKVRLKREIVTMGCPTVKPVQAPAAGATPTAGSPVGTYVGPQDWDGLIADPGTLVIDTRNAYEVAVGSFEGALDPGTESFRQFPAWVESHLRPLVAEQQPKALALFCTGGIRCEKATAYLLQQGFQGVHHLQGGILQYLEDVPESGSRWRGECFVFDQRVSVNHQLEPGSYRLCHACGLPLSPTDCQLASYVPGVSCRHCLSRFSDDDRRRFGERQRQIALAAARGQGHIGVGPSSPGTSGHGPSSPAPHSQDTSGSGHDPMGREPSSQPASGQPPGSLPAAADGP